ncbi:MAG: alpha-2-macroglobulin family protein, partial [Pseudomonadota bacterium]
IAFDRDGNADVTLTLPDFNGELRLMAVVWSETGVGSASTPLTVRDPVPAEVILPRFLAPGDEAIATLTIDNVEGAPGAYKAGVTSSASSIQVPETVIDVPLERGERGDRPLTIKADIEGIAELELNVEGPDDFAAESTYPIQVRGAYLPQTDYRRLTLNPGESFTPGADAFRSFVPGSETMRVSVSTTPIDVSGLSALLTTYPYACTEQLVSRATPLLLKNDRRPEETQALQADIDALLERQSADGAFGMWRVSDRQASPWLGAYATDFIARSKEQGLRVPDQALTRAYQALQPISQGELRRAYGYNYRWADGPFSADTFELLSQRSSAYALYILTRGGVVDRSRLRYVHDTQLSTINSPLARAQIAAALAALGDRGRAANAFAAAEAISAYRNPGDWYQSVARDMAGRAELLAEAGETEAAGDLLVEVAEQLPEPERMRTQDKAFLIRAADALEAGNRTPTITRGDERIGEITLTRNDNLDLPFENTSRQPLFVSVLTEGTPALAPPPASSALALSKRMTSTDGRPVDLASVRQGDRLIVALTITPQRRARSQYVITDLLPAGFEIEAVLGPAEAAPRGPYAFLGQLIRPDIAEARDDRFVASSILGGNTSRTMAYVIRAVTPGNFTAPGGVAEDMYDPTVFARTASGTVVISP